MSEARDLNKEFVHNALRHAGLSHSQPHKDYAARRLNEGEVKYGPDQFLEADCAAEAAEEGIDGANWAAFEWVKRWQDDTLDRECDRLTNAAVHFAKGYEELRAYLATRPDT